MEAFCQSLIQSFLHADPRSLSIIELSYFPFPSSIFSSPNLHPFIERLFDSSGGLQEDRNDLAKFCKAIVSAKMFFKRDQFEDCFGQLIEAVASVRRVVPSGVSDRGVWVDEVFRILLNDFVKVERFITGDITKCMQALKSCLSTCKGAQSMMTLKIVNTILRFEFKRHNYQPIKNFFPFAGLKTFPTSHQVNYLYYSGKFYLYNNELFKSKNAFSEAWNLCPAHMVKNRRLILMYLAPLNTYYGRFPREELLSKYGLSDYYYRLLASTRCGDIRNFELAARDNAKFYAFTGVYNLVEKLKMIAYRSFVKSVYMVHLPTVKPEVAHQFKLDKCFTALNHFGIAIDSDEFECILANLVYSSHIRGYLSNTYETQLVFGKEPFRKLSQNKVIKKE